MELPPFDSQMIGFACLGAVIPDVLRMIKDKYGVVPDYIKSWFFWLCVLFSVAIGGFAAWLAQPEGLVNTLAVGFSAPAILTQLLSKPPEISTTDRGLKVNIRQWWS